MNKVTLKAEADTVDTAGRVSFWQTVGSVLAAFYGVQSSRNRVRDFNGGNPLTFMLVGFLLTTLFALTLLGVVKLMMHSAGM